MKTLGSILVLGASLMYYVFGLIANLLTANTLGATGTDFLLIILTYLLAIVIGILGIISFFKNVGFAIFTIAGIILLLDFATGATLGVMLTLVNILGGILITVGYKRKNKKMNA